MPLLFLLEVLPDGKKQRNADANPQRKSLL